MLQELYGAKIVPHLSGPCKTSDGLPAAAFAVSPYTGNIVQIYRGDSCLYAAHVAKPEVLAAESNRRRGVTAAQAAAMLAGALYGWADDRADPARYDRTGKWKG